MNKLFYPKLAVTNIRKNSRTYFPYILTCMGCAAMYYMILGLSLNPGLETMLGGTSMAMLLNMGSWVTAIFCIIFLFYTNSFLMKRRKKEFGLYNILGMEKKHIARVIGWETVLIGAGSLLIGLLVGILLYKLLFLALLQLLSAKVTLGFEISWDALITTCVLFGGIFLLILLNSLAQIHVAKPIELLHGGMVGEKEPKARWFLALIGLGLLGTGYYLSITTIHPVAALYRFFFAVILVIFGTYFLFAAGSITLLKLLRRNKGYYYQTRHFISVSSMMYRMKKNAAGLANICILSTMLLVTVSTTLSLFVGIDDVMQSRYPKNVSVELRNPTDEKIETMHNWVNQSLTKHNMPPVAPVQYTYIAINGLLENNSFSIESFNNNIDENKLSLLVFLPLEDYNQAMGTSYQLNSGEALLYSPQTKALQSKLTLFSHEFQIKEQVQEFNAPNLIASEALRPIYLVVKDKSVLQELDAQIQSSRMQEKSSIKTMYGFDLNADRETTRLLINSMVSTMEPTGLEVYLETLEDNRDELLGVFGGLFFIGIFLGSLFLMATILIIYYKQISEGYEDKERFRILQQVGMSHAEVRKAIHSQVLTVFFLPLVTAAMHVAFAFPVITRLLAVLNLTNIPLFTFYTLVCLAVFAVFYAIIYAATAKTYYKIVK